MKELWKILAYALIGVLLCTNIYQCRRGGSAGLPLGSYTDTIPYFDTIPFYKPVPRDSVVIRWVTQTLPAADKDTSDKISPPDSAYSDLNGQNKPFENGLTVQVPITQKRYETNEYRAYVSGYRPSLDSLVLFRKTNLVYVQPPQKSWELGLVGGIDGCKFGTTVSAGLELGYTKDRWTISAQGGYMADKNGGSPYGGVNIKFCLLKF